MSLVVYALPGVPRCLETLHPLLVKVNPMILMSASEHCMSRHLSSFMILIIGISSFVSHFIPRMIQKFILILHSGNPVNHFPVYEPSAERIAQIAAEHAEENNPLNIHYDASQEVRAKGAGFYQFSGDEETRRAQMEELRMAREETEKTRHETGAVDVRPGEIEGMRLDPGGVGASIVRSRAMEKRKREIEERRKMIDAKRRKVKGDAGEMSNPAPPSGSGLSTSKSQTAAGGVAIPSPPRPAADPSAGLQAKSTLIREKGNVNVKATPASEADSFLAQLEQDFLASKKK